MNWIGELLAFLAALSGGAVPIFRDESDKAREERRQRDYEAWHKKHGSKWDKK